MGAIRRPSQLPSSPHQARPPPPPHPESLNVRPPTRATEHVAVVRRPPRLMLAMSRIHAAVLRMTMWMEVWTGRWLLLGRAAGGGKGLERADVLPLSPMRLRAAEHTHEHQPARSTHELTTDERGPPTCSLPFPHRVRRRGRRRLGVGGAASAGGEQTLFRGGVSREGGTGGTGS
jgi:hypothetical protein